MTETSFTLDLGDPMRAGVYFVTPDDIRSIAKPTPVRVGEKRERARKV